MIASEKQGVKKTSRWGENDEIGALNELNSRHVVEATGLIKKGEVHSLGHVLEMNVPTPPNHGPFFYTTHRTHEYVLRHRDVVIGGYMEGRASMTCRLEMGDHTGTHIDALNHIAMVDHVYNGFKVEEITGVFGTSRLGIDTVPPIFCRGVLLDVANAKSSEVLEPGYEITIADLESTLLKEDIQIAKPTAVLIRTGWGKYWKGDPQKYLGHEPGLGLKAAQWLVEKGAVLIGADNFALESIPHSGPITVHGYLLVDQGIHIVENLALENISKKGLYEFAFICTPLLIKGATGSPITPIAVA